jgi:hypothetical protein
VSAATVAVAGVSANDVCAAVETWLRAELNAALDARAAASAVTLKHPVTYQQVQNPRLLRDNQTPCIDISSPGLVEQPERRNGRWQADWSVVVTVYVRGKSHAEVAAAVREYTEVLRSTLLADPHPHLGGLAFALRWADEDYDTLPVDDSRTLGGGAVEFVYSIDRAADPAA